MSARISPLPPRTLRKYMGWDPANTNAENHLLDTGITATLPGDSKVFGGDFGVIYEITKDGVLKSYKDNSDTGGSLLTPVKTYGSGWGAYQRVWANGGASSGAGMGRIFAQATDGSITVFVQSSPTTGDGTVTAYSDKIPATVPAASAMAAADDVWAIGTVTYTLAAGEVRAWNYSEAVVTTTTGRKVVPSFAVRGGTVNPGDNVVATGLDQARKAWSPGPGVIYAQGAAGDVKSYAGTPLAETNPEVGVGFNGTLLVDPAECLTPALDEKPLLAGQAAPEAGDLAAPAPEETPAEGPATVSGRITLGDGSPAAGMTVNIDPVDPSLVAEDGSETQVKPLGTAVTAADGTWSFTLPAQLPADLQAIADANSGVLNVSATAYGHTASGIPMFAVDHLAAAPEASLATSTDGSPARSALAAATTAEPAHTVTLLPAAGSDADTSDPTAAEEKTTYAAQYEALPTTSPDDAAQTPEWQNDRGASPGPGYNPYLVNGTDTRSLAVIDDARSPNVDGCYEWTKVLSSSIAYTTVGEAHAYWDAKASFDYKHKMSTSVEVAVKGAGKNWSISGTATLGGSAGSSSGFANRGPYFGKHWRVPVNYQKQKVTRRCFGSPDYTFQRVVATGYKVPAGGYTGVYGKDVSHLDGTRYYYSPSWKRARVARNSYYSLNRGRSAKISGSVSVFGLSLGASSQLDNDHEQRITAGGSAASTHDIWGYYDRPGSGKEGVFYSY
ncbi:hypothetical protein [Streptomyces sp. NPDC057413]|uniref:hypothetical protein n=1 Tax=Streptomyces sp. NPDC057413 TaxID=3346124 RepID=UPI0036ADE450